MTAVALVLLWSAWWVALATRFRPRGRSGADRLRPSSTRRTFGPGRRVAALGEVIRRCAGRPPDPAADASVGLAVIVTVGGALLLPPAGGVAGVAVWAWGRSRRRRSAAALASEVIAGQLEAAELLGIALRGGCTVRGALTEVVPWLDGPLAAGLRVALERADLGWPLAEELERIPILVDPGAAPIVGALVAAERHGAPAVPAMDQLGADLRQASRRRLEEAARRLPVRLLFPLVAGVLPAFGLLTVVPLVASSLGDLAGR